MVIQRWNKAINKWVDTKFCFWYELRREGFIFVCPDDKRLGVVWFRDASERHLFIFRDQPRSNCFRDKIKTDKEISSQLRLIKE